MKNKRYYNPIRYYKKFKTDYLEFVVFVKNADYYYTYDADAKIALYILGGKLDSGTYKIKKEEFSRILKNLHENGLNVILVGKKKVQEFYTDKESKYMKIRSKSKDSIKCNAK